MVNKTKRILDKVRSSISFSHDIYTDLEKIAYEKKVLLAWIVRNAVEIYIKDQREVRNVQNI